MSKSVSQHSLNFAFRLEIKILIFIKQIGYIHRKWSPNFRASTTTTPSRLPTIFGDPKKGHSWTFTSYFNKNWFIAWRRRRTWTKAEVDATWLARGCAMCRATQCRQKLSQVVVSVLGLHTVLHSFHNASLCRRS